MTHGEANIAVLSVNNRTRRHSAVCARAWGVQAVHWNQWGCHDANVDVMLGHGEGELLVAVLIVQ